MQQFSYVIKDELGLHARPAGLLVKAAAVFKSTVTLEAKGKSVDAKKLIRVMGVGVKQNDEVVLKIEGEDEEAAAAALETFFGENL
ncbi:MAG: HPr family phosphocarrier protein [Lachnospiraceae bacterium]|nr:HPr family phosphocarrier protein [Lachnospiraceae bacterium]MDY5742761.1 HPr family phosphocarrier protein [Lachnospiraceae bacterium]